MASIGAENSQQVSLNVMPLLDIFSILILFLLMSFSSDPVNHDVNQGVELPNSLSMVSLDEVPTIVLSKANVMVNDKVIGNLVNGAFSEKEEKELYHVLDVELEKLAEAGKKFEKVEDKGKMVETLTFEIDKSQKFRLLKRVMLSAQQAEYVKFKLMVEKQTS